MVILLSHDIYSFKEVLIEIHTPIIRYSWEIGSRSIYSMPDGESTVISGELLASLHFPDVSQMNYRRYHLVFVTLV